MSGINTINTIDTRLAVVVADVERVIVSYKSSLDAESLTVILPDADNCRGEYEPRAAKHHWAGRYAEYVVACIGGATRDEAAADTGHYEVAAP